MIEIPLDAIFCRRYAHAKKAKRKIERAFAGHACFPQITYGDIIAVTERDPGIVLRTNRNCSDVIVKTSSRPYSGWYPVRTDEESPRLRKKIESAWSRIDLSGIKPERDYGVS